MEKVKNPFELLGSYNCFACSPHNSHGLHLEFFREGDNVFAFFKTDIKHEGFPGMLHGGIAGTILDEVMFWASFEKTKIMAVTLSMELKYKHPLPLGADLKATARVIEVKRRTVTCESQIEDKDRKVFCSAKGIYYMPDRKRFSQMAQMDVDKGPLAGFFR